MTWSIVARDMDGSFGVAIASRFFAVGALCPFVRAGVGALATQALCNPLYASPALDAMSRGDEPASIVATLTAADEGREHRQIHMIDSRGRIGVHTGASCVDWCGQWSGTGFSVAGNMLAGPAVLEATAGAYEAAASRPFADRLLTALAAGERAGGDKRGKQAAALLIATTEDYPALDLRVDDHHDPIAEIMRLYEKSAERFQPFVACLPSRHRPAGIFDRTVIETEIERFKNERTKR
ncbi:MAG TPA: DUF1028 domain-containing protein [Casimicrobiaceae bacterium]|jgi:uncharacterized Ntn-hydrolase superfamily protein